MHAVGRIADKGEARRHVSARQMHFERPGLARTGDLQRSEAAGDARFDLGEEASVVERQNAGRFVGLLGPGEAGAVARQRQDREGACGQEVLDSASIVRVVVGDGGDDGGLAVAPADGLDPGAIARSGAASLGADQERRRELASIAQGDGHMISGIGEAVDLGGCDDGKAGIAGYALVEHACEGGGGHNVARGGGIIFDEVVVFEQHRADTGSEARVRDLDPGHGRGVLGDRLPDVERLQHAPRAGREGEGTGVGSGGRLQGCPIDESQADVAAERRQHGAGEREAGEARSRDDDVEALGAGRIGHWQSRAPVVAKHARLLQMEALTHLAAQPIVFAPFR